MAVISKGCFTQSLLVNNVCNNWKLKSSNSFKPTNKDSKEPYLCNPRNLPSLLQNPSVQGSRSAHLQNMLKTCLPRFVPSQILSFKNSKEGAKNRINRPHTSSFSWAAHVLHMSRSKITSKVISRAGWNMCKSPRHPFLLICEIQHKLSIPKNPHKWSHF